MDKKTGFYFQKIINHPLYPYIILILCIILVYTGIYYLYLQEVTYTYDCFNGTKYNTTNYTYIKEIKKECEDLFSLPEPYLITIPQTT